MNRRLFLGALGALGIVHQPGGARMHPGAQLEPPFPFSLFPFPLVSRSPKLGIQLYAVRDALDHDFEGTLEALARIGYREVEFAGLHGHPAAEVRALLDRLRLAAPAGHISLEDLEQKFDSVVADAKTLGHQWVIVPWLPEELRNVAGYTQVAVRLSHLAPRLKRAGLTLGYHNHYFEFDRLDNGSCGYDILLAGTAAAGMVMELDLFWIRKGGADAVDYFHRYPGRFRMVHVKDMAADGSQVNVGDGLIPWPALLHTARQAGVAHFFLEHDEPPDQLAFARDSYAYLSRQRF